MSNFKVGDFVTIRWDLSSPGNYDLWAAKSMLKYRGMRARIVAIIHTEYYVLCIDKKWTWTAKMFEGGG